MYFYLAPPASGATREPGGGAIAKKKKPLITMEKNFVIIFTSIS